MTTIGVNGQNYLFKSESHKDQEEAILKLDKLQTVSLNSTNNNQTDNFLNFERRKKTRLLVKRGVVNVSLLLTDIALIYTKDKLVYVIDRYSKKYSIDQTLVELEVSLNSAVFFRANRQCIINIDFLKSFKAYKKVKLLVDINISELEFHVIISPHVAPKFKKWMNDA